MKGFRNDRLSRRILKSSEKNENYMSITFYKPKSDLLSQYIEGFYFISELDTLKSNQYWTFPSNFCLATICQDTELIPEKDKITIRRSTIKRIDSFLFYNISKPVNVTYEEPRNELTIYFKPLAIFHFFPKLSLSSTRDHLENFKPYPDYQTKIQDLFKINNKDEQANMLENYLISKLCTPKLETIRNILQKVEEGWKLNDIAGSMGISRQYLHRIFFKYTGKSPSLYKRIHRFRQVTSSLQTNEKFISLSHENLFFDQPHFNREFKALTGVVPTVFFKNINVSKDMLWLFV